MLSPYKFNYGQIISTDAEGVSVDRSFLAHVNIPAATAVAADTDGIIDGAEGPSGAEADAATIVNSATALESNTADMAGTPDGLKDIDLYIIV